MKRVAPIVLLVLLAACGSKSPTSPAAVTPTATVTKTINVFGSMNFGSVGLNSSRVNKLTIQNQGNTPLTITGISAPASVIAVTTVSWTAGTIAPGANQDVSITFTPTALTTYSGSIVINGDQTGGTNSITFSGTGTLDGIPIFSQSGSGNTVFTMPAYITTVRLTGTLTSGSSSNFIIWVGPAGSACDVAITSGCRLLANELLGSFFGQTSYTGTLQTGGGGLVQIVKSSAVAWSITEVR